jgi:hypothetical protein
MVSGYYRIGSKLQNPDGSRTLVGYGAEARDGFPALVGQGTAVLQLVEVQFRRLEDDVLLEAVQIDGL